MRPLGLLVYPGGWVPSGAFLGSFGSIECALGVVGFIRVRWVHSVAPLRSSGFRPCVRWVHPVSLGSLGCALGVFGFILCEVGVFGFMYGRFVHSGAHLASMFSLVRALGVIGFIQGRWVHSGAHWESLGSSGVVGFNRVHTGGCWTNPG